MLNQCLPVALHAPCHLIFQMGKELEAIKSIRQKTNVLNVKYMLTSFLAGVVGGSSFLVGVDCYADVSEPALKRCCGIICKKHYL